MLTLVSVFFVCSGIGIAAHIAYDLISHKQSMKIMNIVWILTGLWGNYLALWAYRKFGRSKQVVQNKMDMGGVRSMDQSMSMEDSEPMKMNMEDMPMDMDMSMDHSSTEQSSMANMDMKDMSMDMKMPMDMGPKLPKWQSVALSALHCGAGCTLADMIGEWISHYIHFEIAGSMLLTNWIIDFILALIIGVYFQFYAIREMEKISVGRGLAKAFKADFFSLTSWQVGMYGWMAIVYFVIFDSYPLVESRWTFWFMMQIAMLFGFACAYPMNALLIKLGIKKGM